MYIATQLLIATLLTSTSATAGVDDLCEVVHRLTGTPTICQPHKEGAPIYDANVCCAGGTCFPTSAGGCQEREELYHCALGEVTPTGEVACYFEVPDYCKVHFCPADLAPFPWEAAICCVDGYCVEITANASSCDIDNIYTCGSLVCNDDGSVTCVDDE